MRRTCFPCLALALLLGCGTTPPPPPPEPKEEASVEQRLAAYRAAVDAAAAKTAQTVGSEEERALLEADLAFGALAREVGADEAFARVLLPDGKTFPVGEPPTVGPEAARASLQGAGKDWWWAPVEVRVSGDLGVTWGVAAIRVASVNGNVDAVQTRYVSVWRKDPEGRWKLWLDIGNRGPGS